MKKLILLLILIPLIGKSQTTIPYVEANLGFSTGIIPFFPGASALYGATTKYESGFLLDYQAGIAFPTLFTAKGGVGYDINGTELSIGIRPWPTSTYLQVVINRSNKLSNIVISAESMLFSDVFVQRGILTVGWRFNNLKYRDIKHK
jgi:hypothetical protein